MPKSASLKLDRFVPYRMSVASNLVSDVIARAYRTLFGLSVPEWRLVAVLAERGRISQLELGSATRMDKVTVSRAAIALVERGLLETASNPLDKRSRLLALSESGAEVYAQVAPKALELERVLLAEFSEEEIEVLTAMLLRLEAAAARVGS